MSLGPFHFNDGSGQHTH